MREPFLHFILIGALLFGVYQLSVDDSYYDLGNNIRISANDIDSLRATWRSQNGTEPDRDTLDGLIDSLIYEEVLLREAQRLSLDKNDTIVRRRLVQKMEFLSANLSQLETPDDESLLQYYEVNRENYRVAERRSFRHVYFSREQRGESLMDEANDELKKIREDDIVQTAHKLGDNFILQYTYRNRRQQQIATGIWR